MIEWRADCPLCGEKMRVRGDEFSEACDDTGRIMAAVKCSRCGFSYRAIARAAAFIVEATRIDEPTEPTDDQRAAKISTTSERDKITLILARRKWTQAHLAKILGASTGAVNAWANGKTSRGKYSGVLDDLYLRTLKYYDSDGGAKTTN